MKHTDKLKFNNLLGMCVELEAVGLADKVYGMPEAEIVFQYNLQFLANTYEHQNESRYYKPRGIRMASGPYKGKFPSTGPKE